GTVVVVGGGCYGSYYVRQLGRAVKAGALEYERLLVVDRDAACRVASERTNASAERVDGAPTPEVIVSEWESFFDRYLEEAERTGSENDAIVPSPLMPHLMYR